MKSGKTWIALKRALWLGLFIAAAPAVAQTGGIDVCVSDADGQPLPGVTVTLSNEQQLSPVVADLTGQNGCAAFPVLRVGGSYGVEVSMPGFATRRYQRLRVSSAQTTIQTVVLTQQLTERVEVSGRVAVVDLDKTGSSTRFDAVFIENLPVPGRFYQNILTLAPGVQDGDGDGNPNVHGARERNFRAIVDGVANTDPLTGEWLSLLNTDAIEEMEILTSGAGVEYGRASGGFARIIMKQGSNDFEGLFSFIWRSSKLDGGASGDIVSTPEGGEFEWLQPAIQLSGPIVKDRLWYRLSYESISREDPIVTLSGLVTTTRRQAITSNQLTWQLSPRNKVSFSLQLDPTTIENFGVSSRVSPASSQRVRRDGPTYTVKWTAPLSPRLLIESTVAYQDLERGFFPMVEGQENRCAVFGAIDGFFLPFNTARCFDSGTGLVSGSHNETWEDSRQRLTVGTNATWFTNRLFGFSHRFKLGIVSENERYFRRLHRTPSITFEVERDAFIEIGRTFVRVSAPPDAANSATGNSWAVYVEDQFKPAQNLSITLGLRFDREEIFSRGMEALSPEAEAERFENTILSVPSIDAGALLVSTFTGFPQILNFQRDLAAAAGAGQGQLPLGSIAQQSAFWRQHRRAESIAITNNNFSPRLSVAWDPWSDGKTKVAVTAGRYYDKIVLAIPLIELEPPVAELEFISFKNEEGRFVNQGLFGGFNPTITVNTVDRDLRTPYQDEFTFSLEREIAPETSLHVTYVRRRYRDQIQDVDRNHVTADKGRCILNGQVGRPTVVSSPGEGFTYVDPYTGEIVTDTDPGIGDGIIDDCTGEVRSEGPIPILGTLFEVPDGLPDLYILNPGWGQILEIGNNNSTNYKAFVLELVRRMYHGWQLAASYTWSEAIGDAEDFDQILGNERNLLDQERGFLSYDQTHVVKVNAMKVTRWGVRVGGVVRWESGLPFSVLQSRATIWARSPLLPAGDKSRKFRFRYPSGVRNDQRNPAYWNLDLRLAKEFRLDGRANVQLTVEVFNLLDDKTLRIEDRINLTLGGARRFGRQFQLGLRVGF